MLTTPTPTTATTATTGTEMTERSDYSSLCSLCSCSCETTEEEEPLRFRNVGGCRHRGDTSANEKGREKKKKKKDAASMGEAAEEEEEEMEDEEDEEDDGTHSASSGTNTSTDSSDGARTERDPEMQQMMEDAVFDENVCKICYERDINCVLLECGHLCSCIECGRRLRDCPICRRFISRIVETYRV